MFDNSIVSIIINNIMRKQETMRNTIKANLSIKQTTYFYITNTNLQR